MRVKKPGNISTNQFASLLMSEKSLQMTPSKRKMLSRNFHFTLGLPWIRQTVCKAGIKKRPSGPNLLSRTEASHSFTKTNQDKPQRVSQLHIPPCLRSYYQMTPSKKRCCQRNFHFVISLPWIRQALLCKAGIKEAFWYQYRISHPWLVHHDCETGQRRNGEQQHRDGDNTAFPGTIESTKTVQRYKIE